MLASIYNTAKKESLYTSCAFSRLAREIWLVKSLF